MEAKALFSAIKKMRASDQILEKIRQTILSGKFGVEERLPSERELAEQFGVNRGTVREALKILEESG
ncbi:MAG: GntR family transcriptional regulator, partial [Deltaproteobacteria bacterium]